MASYEKRTAVFSASILKYVDNEALGSSLSEHITFAYQGFNTVSLVWVSNNTLLGEPPFEDCL